VFVSTTTITVDEVLAGTAGMFRNRNGENLVTGTVHAVKIREDWLGVGKLPVPACGSGVGGTTGRLLKPTKGDVTCRLCLSYTAARAAAVYVARPHQYSLLDQSA
jgi:hypothetical protein